MKKFIYLMTLVFLSLAFNACNEDPLEDIQPTFDLPDVKFTDDEEEERTTGSDGVNNTPPADPPNNGGNGNSGG